MCATVWRNVWHSVTQCVTQYVTQCDTNCATVLLYVYLVVTVAADTVCDTVCPLSGSLAVGLLPAPGWLLAGLGQGRLHGYEGMTASRILQNNWTTKKNPVICLSFWCNKICMKFWNLQLGTKFFSSSFFFKGSVILSFNWNISHTFVNSFQSSQLNFFINPTPAFQSN